MTSHPILSLENIYAGYSHISILKGVSLSLHSGQVYALLGPNGGGKSTALKVCSGQIKPNSGELKIAGRSMQHATPDALARAGLCTIPEGKGIFPNLTVHENLVMMTNTGIALEEIKTIAYERFPQLSTRSTQLAGTLSGGEQQMLSMSRALATKPAILLLDELSMGLAPIIVKQLYEIVAQIAEEGIAVLVVEQFARTVLGVADTAGIMLNGQLLAEGLPTEIQHLLTSAYLGIKPNTL
ncbi:MAG: ABC transporter ATP-binding protein [Acidimicrobiales bacterium]|nr:ABC transporter ATP-binding protein [Acidimicrobiales bacterium]MDG1845706.1 ABC transporter ATP-binding protein [Acidimicrobiales bacterium]